jgi:hypothetical protein
MGLKSLARFALLLAITQAPVPVSGQAFDRSSEVNLPSPPAQVGSSPASPTTGSPSAEASSPSAKTDCDGSPCEDQQQPRMVVTIPSPPAVEWSWHDRILWAACLVLAVVGYAGIVMAFSMLSIVERQTRSTEITAAAAAVGAQAALLNAQAIIDSERPWILITVELTPRIENSFAVMATNRGRTPALIVATSEGIKFAVDETYLPAVPEYGEASAPRIPIILLSGESTAIKTFSRDEGRRICESEERFKRVANWEEKAFIYGKVVYRDLIAPSDKQIHETTWCCWYIHGRQKSGLVLAGPPDYNMHT